MKIENLHRPEDYLTIEDVDPGECFMFAGCTMVCLMLSNGNFVDLSNGDYCCLEDEDDEYHWSARPIKHIFAKVVLGE